MSGYFDFNATTPLHPAAREAWLLACERHWHNPSSLYREAATARRELDDARERLGALLGCEAERIVFTSGATESNNALVAHLGATLDPDALVLSSAIEHPSVREPLRRHFGGRIVLARSTSAGAMDLDDFARRLAESRLRFVTAMAANNECGLLLPWQELAQQCRARGILFHADAAQWIGKMPAENLGCCDYVTGCAHKFGGPKGTGFLVMRDEGEALSYLQGGPQEEGRRAGTEDLPAIMAMVAALEAVTPALPDKARQQAACRDGLETCLRREFQGLRIIGEGGERLWNTTMVVLPRHDNRKWLARLSQRGFAVSTGSACSAGHDGSSVVLGALGAGEAEMRRVLRVSGGWDTPAEQWHSLGRAIMEVGAELDEGFAPRNVAGRA